MVATEQAYEKALARARTEGVKVCRLGYGTYTATSTSQPGHVYKVNGHCDCQAGQNDRLCKHLAAVRSARLRSGELHACYHCGHIGEDVIESKNTATAILSSGGRSTDADDVMRTASRLEQFVLRGY